MSAPGTLRVAAAQYPLDPCADLDAWRAKLTRWVETGAATGARLLVFPEYGAMEQAAIAGPEVAASLERSLAAVADIATDVDRTHAELASRFGLHILAASGPRRTPSGGFCNRATLFAPNGRSGSQDKLIMTPFEVTWGISAGTTMKVFDTDIGRFGIAICYDCEFPLLVRAMAAAGAEAVLIPSCTERLSGYHRVRIGAAARALENQIATVMSPTIGDALWSPAVDHNTGSAGIFVPPEHQLSLTGIIAEGALNDPCWVAGDIDFKTLRALRQSGEMRNFEDWALQPGAGRASPPVQIVDLR